MPPHDPTDSRGVRPQKDSAGRGHLVDLHGRSLQKPPPWWKRTRWKHFVNLGVVGIVLAIAIYALQTIQSEQGTRAIRRDFDSGLGGVIRGLDPDQIAAIARQDSAANASLNTIEDLLKYNDVRKARELFERLVLKIGSPAGLVYLDGVILYFEMEYSKALTRFEAVIVLEPSTVNAWHNKAVVQEALGDYINALATIDSALALSPSDFQIIGEKAAIYIRMGDNHRAAQTLDRALAIAPNDTTNLYNRGIALADSLPEEALKSLTAAAHVRPHHAPTWYSRGYVLEKLGRFEDALQSNERAIQCDPVDPFGWINRGLSLADLNRHFEAIASYDSALAIDSLDSDTWRYRAQSLVKLERYQQADSSWSRAIACADLDTLKVSEIQAEILQSHSSR